MIKQAFITATLALVIAGCTSSIEYRVDGAWEGGDGQTIYLQKATGEKTFETIDSVIVREGTFHLEGTTPDIDKRQLVAGTAKRDILLDGVPVRVTVTTKTHSRTGKDVQAIAVEGSREQHLLEESNQRAASEAFISLGSMMMMSQVKSDSLKLDSVYKAFELIKQEFYKNTRAFLDTTADSHAITYFIADFVANKYPLEDVEYYYDRLTPRVKEGYPGRQLAKVIAELKQINIGGIAPEISLPTPDGSTLSLSSLRGRYVLVDFWASWCGPCLREVPNMKAIYNKYHDSGLEFLGVSLDDSADKWTGAIAQHELNWPHVSSLRGWQCPVAARYHVTGIPAMFLLDREGRVIAINLRGEALEERVAALFDEQEK